MSLRVLILCAFGLLMVSCRRQRIPPVTVDAQAEPQTKTAPVHPCVDDAEALVRVIDANHCVASREAVVGGNQNCLTSHSSVAPAIVDGGPGGFRLTRLNPRSAYALCGMRTGDIFQSLNGRSLAKPEDALAVFPILREARALAIGILRDGKPLVFHIELK